MKIDYSKLSDKQLQDKLKEFEFRKVQSGDVNHRPKVGAKEKPESYSRFRREVARIKTEINQRRKSGIKR